MSFEANSPIPFKRLEQIATDACNSTLAGVEAYDHSKTGQWNESIIQKVLKAVTAEATPQPGSNTPAYKFAINSCIIQQAIPTAQSSKSTGTSTSAAGDDGKPAPAPAKKGPGGRRGMHSATGGYWNEKTDGMWSFKFDSDDRDLDIIIMLVWVGI